MVAYLHVDYFGRSATVALRVPQIDTSASARPFMLLSIVFRQLI